MTSIELATLALLAAITLLGAWRLISRHRRWEYDMGREPSSNSFASAAASTLLALKLDPLVGPGSVLYLPVGDGRYLTRTTPGKARAWRRTLRTWLERGAAIHVIATLPNRAAKELWAGLGQGYADFRYHELERDTAEPRLAREIARLDTYHPIVLVNRAGPAKPGAMWLEQNHPIDSATAYGVQFVPPAQTRDDPRFEVFLAVYDLLLPQARAAVAPTQERKVA